jgi:phage shock protein E
MIKKIKNLFRMGPSVDYGQLLKEGALILDVRSKNEYSGGHIKGSINIPIDQLSGNLHKLKDKNKPIITCCASGMRSASAKSILESQGYQKVYNGGGWYSLQSKL